MAAVAFAWASAFGQVTSPEPPPDPVPQLPDAGARANAGTRGDDATSPALDCFRAAARSAAAPGTAASDAYVCDLAVQMARDGGSGEAQAAALTNRALVLAADGRLEPALADLDAALALTPDDPTIYGNRGNLLLRLGRPVEALAAHNRAADLAPEDPASYYNRAFSYRALGEPVRAEQDVAAARALLQRQRPAFRSARTPGLDADRFR